MSKDYPFLLVRSARAVEVPSLSSDPPRELRRLAGGRARCRNPERSRGIALRL